MEAITTFLMMDGYGEFVWPVYGIALLLCGTIWIRRSHTLRTLEKQRRNAESKEDQVS